MAYYHRFYAKAAADTSTNPMRLNGMKGFIINHTNEFFENFDYDTEKEIVAAMLKMYYEAMPDYQKAEIIKKIGAKDQFKKYVAKAFKKSAFTSKEKYAAFAKEFSLKKLKKDPLFILVNEMMNKYDEINGTGLVKNANDELARANRLFVDGIRKMNTDKTYYPNANSTLRLTYGVVGDYKARDAVHYDYYTTIGGIMEKENPAKDDPNNEFVIEDKLKALWEAKDYGQYGENGDLVVNFISNNDITGGNSGSPVLNAKGELIGCAFDGNWEAMSGDVFFEDNVQRTISVDIRYVLFIVDKYAGATNLIDEMTLVK